MHETCFALTGMESGLKRCQSVVFQHVEKSLGEVVNVKPLKGEEQVLTVFPALSRPRNRILAFLCKRPSTTSESAYTKCS